MCVIMVLLCENRSDLYAGSCVTCRTCHTCFVLISFSVPFSPSLNVQIKTHPLMCDMKLKNVITYYLGICLRETTNVPQTMSL